MQSQFLQIHMKMRQTITVKSSLLIKEFLFEAWIKANSTAEFIRSLGREYPAVLDIFLQLTVYFL